MAADACLSCNIGGCFKSKVCTVISASAADNSWEEALVIAADPLLAKMMLLQASTMTAME